MRTHFPVTRWLSLLLASAALAGPATARVPAPPPEVDTIPVALLVDLGSGQVLHARKPDLAFVPASMTKVMTAYVAFQEIASGRLALDHRFTVREETARQWKGRGTSMYLDAGERVSADDLLRGIMTASANDASVVLAEGYAGSVQAWSLLMNEAAQRLNLTGSRFNTSNGWPDGGRTYVTARDLATLSQAMLTRYPGLYRRYAGNKTMVWKGRTLTSRDPVMGVVPGADGIKTGYTREAGYNFLGSAERDGRRLVMVIAGARSEDQRSRAARAFLEWGYSAWRMRPLWKSGDVVGEARVQGGDARSVGLVAPRDLHASLPRDGDEQIALKIVYRGPVHAPIAKGARIAELEIAVDGMEPGRVPLEAAHSVGAAGPMDRLWNGFMNLVS
jgi:serine-type D-Ala-D-Ala carboxypeptidase (penicillin-binding protein 5/6)